MTNYLHRPLFPHLRAALASDGVLLYETFAMGNEAFGRPHQSGFLLCRDELLTIAALPPPPSPWWRSNRAKSTMARAARSCSGWRPSGRVGYGRRYWRRRNACRLANRPPAIGSLRPPESEGSEET